MLSTIHSSDTQVIPARRGKPETTKPTAVLEYNQHMGGVDLADQLLNEYPTERRRRRVWYKKFFRHLINQAVLNSYIIHRQVATKKLTHLDFRTKLLNRIWEMYLTDETRPKGQGRPPKPSTLERLTERHFPSEVPAKGDNLRPNRKCKVCCSQKSRTGERCQKRTRYECEKCDVGLCVAPCFELFHTLEKY